MNEPIERLLDELDRGNHKVELSGEEVEPSCRRGSPRRRFRARGVIRSFSNASTHVFEVPARTRNLSRSGLAIIVRRPFNIGDPIEVQIDVPNQGHIFLAGCATFCRYAGRGYHELGVSLRAAGPAPIFSHNVEKALATLDWLHAAHESAPAEQTKKTRAQTAKVHA